MLYYSRLCCIEKEGLFYSIGLLSPDWFILYTLRNNKQYKQLMAFMRIIEKIKVEEIIAKGRKASEQEITAMLDELEEKHPNVYRMIYGEPSDDIALISKEMAELYLDLSCDVIWFFSYAFGKLPKVVNEEEWVTKHLSLIDAELKSLTHEIPMNSKFRRNLQERFVRRSLESKIQLELIQHLENEVIKYASFKRSRNRGILLTNNLLFVLVRLLGDLYLSVESTNA